MRIDWDRGTIDFKKKSKQVAVELTPARMLIGTLMLPMGLIIGWIGLLSPIHELGHAIGAWISGGGATIHWDYCQYTFGSYGKAQMFVTKMSGCFFGTIIWTFIAVLLMKRHPELSIFPMAYAVGEVFNVFSQYDIATTDLYKNPVGAAFVFTGMMVCVIFYAIRLTGGLKKWLTKGAVFK